MTDIVVSDWQRAHAELVRISSDRAVLDREEGRWLLVAQRAGVHTRLGFATFAEYVERVLGHAPRTTDDKLRVAAALERLPRLDAALGEATLGWSAVREITRVATPETEGDWIAAAHGSTVREIERMVNGRQPGDRPTDPARPEARRHVLRFDVSAETLATYREALARLRRDASEPIDDDAALLLMARAVLGGPTDAGRASYQIAMTVCERCKQGTQQGKGDAIVVEPAIVEMAECDAQHIAGGRAAQTIPPAARREVMRRDGGCCAVPGCRNAVFLDLHHVKPRAEGGTHDPAMLVVLCAAHHRAHHRGRLIIDGSAGTGFTFRHADGSPYGRIGSTQAADAAARAFAALCKLGFKDREVRRALDRVRTHVGRDDGIEALIRAVLGVLSSGGLAA